MNNFSAAIQQSKFITFFNDRVYFRELWQFTLPIALQNLVTSSINMVSAVMIGQLGDAPVAAVGLANQIFFLLQLILFGINSGSAMFTAQLWGKQDVVNIRKVLSLALIMGLVVASIFLAFTQLAPEFVIGIYSKDPAVVELGSEYLRIFGWSFLLLAVSLGFAMVMRSTGQVRIPVSVSTSALVLNIILSYMLIFGKFGLPALGMLGAAIAALSARVFEFAAMVGIVYYRRMPIALHLKDFSDLSLAFAGRVFKPILPVILNETFWSFGITAYFVVYARIGTDSVAAMNIVSAIDNLALVVIFGIANATAIIVGNRIGAGEDQRAFLYGVRSLILVITLGVLIGSQVILWSPYILSLYKVSPQVMEYAKRILSILGLFLWVRGANGVIVVGILRSGGDTRFSFFLDGLIIWLVGVPTAFFTAFVLKWPVYWVYLAILSEEVIKFCIGTWRTLSKRWIHNLTQTL